jgi:hypothetical protein
MDQALSVRAFILSTLTRRYLLLRKTVPQVIKRIRVQFSNTFLPSHNVIVKCNKKIDRDSDVF